MNWYYPVIPDAHYTARFGWRLRKQAENCELCLITCLLEDCKMPFDLHGGKNKKLACIIVACLPLDCNVKNCWWRWTVLNIKCLLVCFVRIRQIRKQSKLIKSEEGEGFPRYFSAHQVFLSPFFTPFISSRLLPMSSITPMSLSPLRIKVMWHHEWRKRHANSTLLRFLWGYVFRSRAMKVARITGWSLLWSSEIKTSFDVFFYSSWDDRRDFFWDNGEESLGWWGKAVEMIRSYSDTGKSVEIKKKRSDLEIWRSNEI